MNVARALDRGMQRIGCDALGIAEALWCDRRMWDEAGVQWKSPNARGREGEERSEDEGREEGRDVRRRKWREDEGGG